MGAARPAAGSSTRHVGLNLEALALQKCFPVWSHRLALAFWAYLLSLRAKGFSLSGRIFASLTKLLKAMERSTSGPKPERLHAKELAIRTLRQTTKLSLADGLSPEYQLIIAYHNRTPCSAVVATAHNNSRNNNDGSRSSRVR